MRRLWQTVTYFRHRSELRALRLARRMPVLSMLPIAALLCFWWIVVPFPVVFALMALVGALGPIAVGLSGILVIVVVLMAAAWCIDWYLIALTLTMGHHSAATRKEEALVTAISGYRKASA